MVEGPLQRLSLKQVTASPSGSNQEAPTATLVQAHPKKTHKSRQRAAGVHTLVEPWSRANWRVGDGADAQAGGKSGN